LIGLSCVDENNLVDDVGEPLSASDFSVGEESAALSTAQTLEHQDAEASGRVQDSSVLYDYQNALSLRLVQSKRCDRRPRQVILPAVVSDLEKGNCASALCSEEHSTSNGAAHGVMAAVHPDNPEPSTTTVRGVKPLVKKFEAWASTQATQPDDLQTSHNSAHAQR
jgi:hypothetical protein